MPGTRYVPGYGPPREWFATFTFAPRRTLLIGLYVFAAAFTEGTGVDWLARMAAGTLSKAAVSFRQAATGVKYVVPEGYGTRPMAGQPVRIDEEALARTRQFVEREVKTLLIANADGADGLFAFELRGGASLRDALPVGPGHR